MASKYDSRKHCIVLLCCVIISGIVNCQIIEITQPPRDAYALRDAPLLLDCATSGQGPIAIEWQRNGQDINLDGERSVLGNGSLLIDAVLPKKDAGVYQCCVTNAFGTICSASVTVTIANLPRFDVHPVPQTVTEGSTARFICHTQATPSPSIIWKHDKKTLDPTTDTRITTLPNGILQLVNITPNDAGDYRCIAQNIADKRRSQPAALVIEPRVGSGLETDYIPQIIAGPTPLTRVTGESAIFECLVDGEASTLEVSWSRQDGRPIRTQGVLYTGRQNLHITSVTTSDAGIYVCTATNTVTGKEIQGQGQLTVYDPPTITVAPEEEGGVVSKTVRFSCEANGSPAPTIRWLHNGREVTEGGIYKLQGNNDYVIEGIIPANNGIIQCVAENTAGIATAATTLQVGDYAIIPPPTNIRGIVLSSTSILVTWNPPEQDTGDILAYTIHYQPTTGDEVELQEALGAQEFSKKLIDLLPFTTYAINLQCWTEKGPSIPSGKMFVTTQQAPPEKPPAFTLSSNNPETVTIGWQPLSDQSANGVVNMYKIIWNIVGGSAAKQKEWEVNGELTEYTIVDLQEDTVYNVRMAAKTTNYGPLSEWVSVRTWTSEGPNVTTPHAPHVELNTPNPTSIEVNLALPSLSSEITGYKIFYKHKGAKADEGDIDLPAMITRHVFQNLDEGTTYEIRALAYNSQGEGHSVVQAITTPSVSNILWPDLINVTSFSSHIVRLKWRKPATSTSIKGYTIKYWQKGKSNSSRERFVPASDNQSEVTFNLDNLLPFCEYMLQIRSHGLTGPGKYSPKPWSIMTQEDRPSPPSAPKAVPVNDNTIIVQWQPPKQPNGVIRRFIIMYNMEPTENDVTWNQEERNGTARSANVEGLNSATTYYFKVRASTQAGESDPTDVIEAATLGHGAKVGPDKTKGILIGSCLALVCIICCSVFIICKRRSLCSQDYSPHVASEPVNGGPPLRYAVNGGLAKVYMANSNGEDPDASFTPMLSHLPEPIHLDTKGGSPLIINGNGPIGPYHSNGILPQGAGHPPHNHCHDPPDLEDGGSSSLGSTDPDGSGTALLSAEVRQQRSTQELHDSGTEIPMSSLDNAATHTQDLSCHGNSCSGNHSHHQELPHHSTCPSLQLASNHITGVYSNNGVSSKGCDRVPNLPQQNGRAPITACSGVNISGETGSPPPAKLDMSTTTTSPHRKEPVRLKQSTGKSLPHRSNPTQNDSNSMVPPLEDIWERRAPPKQPQNTPLPEPSTTPTSATTSTTTSQIPHSWDDVPKHQSPTLHCDTTTTSPDLLQQRATTAMTTDCNTNTTTSGRSAKICTV